MKTHIFKTHLLRDKKIIREIEVAENINLYKLAEAIVGAYDFDFDHAFGFFSKVTEGWGGLADNKERYELFADLDPKEANGARSVKRTKVTEVWKRSGDTMMMLFDYGDEWRFAVELIGFGETQPKQKYPRVLKSIGIAPEQYPDYDGEDKE